MTETLEYWSSDGVPMRSSVQLGMKGHDIGTLSDGTGRAGAYRTNPVPELDKDVAVTPVDVPPAATGTTGTATEGGDPGAGRMLAANNGLENMRAPTGASLGAAAGVQLAAAASFQMSGGISAGASIGFGVGASAGASIGAGLGASVGVGMAAGGGIGLGASAGAGFGVGASAGAGFGIGASAGAGFGMGASAGASFGMGAAAGAGMSMGGFARSGHGRFGRGQIGFSTAQARGFGMSAGATSGLSSSGGFGMTTSMTTSVTGFDGVTAPRSVQLHRPVGHDQRPVHIDEPELGRRRRGLWRFRRPWRVEDDDGHGFIQPGAAACAAAGATWAYSQFSSTGRLVTSGGRVAASYTAREAW